MCEEIAGTPGSRLAVAACTLVRSVTPEAVCDHALRTCMCGGLRAAAQAANCDEELLVEETLDALPRCDFENACAEILRERISQAPDAVAMTRMSAVGRRHIHGFHCADFSETVRPAFGE